ncbi:MAG: hypothetical protein ACHQVS_02630 [Candidatus Babeliales bacterium]
MNIFLQNPNTLHKITVLLASGFLISCFWYYYIDLPNWYVPFVAAIAGSLFFILKTRFPFISK